MHLTWQIGSSCEAKSKSVDRSANTAVKAPLLSRIFQSFSIISERQCYVPNPFPEPQPH